MSDDLEKRAEEYVQSLIERAMAFNDMREGLISGYIAGAMAERERITKGLDALEVKSPKLIECPKCGKLSEAYEGEDILFCEYCDKYHGYKVKL